MQKKNDNATKRQKPKKADLTALGKDVITYLADRFLDPVSQKNLGKEFDICNV